MLWSLGVNCQFLPQSRRWRCWTDWLRFWICTSNLTSMTYTWFHVLFHFFVHTRPPNFHSQLLFCCNNAILSPWCANWTHYVLCFLKLLGITILERSIHVTQGYWSNRTKFISQHKVFPISLLWWIYEFWPVKGSSSSLFETSSNSRVDNAWGVASLAITYNIVQSPQSYCFPQVNLFSIKRDNASAIFWCPSK